MLKRKGKNSLELKRGEKTGLLTEKNRKGEKIGTGKGKRCKRKKEGKRGDENKGKGEGEKEGKGRCEG